MKADRMDAMAPGAALGNSARNSSIRGSQSRDQTIMLAAPS